MYNRCYHDREDDEATEAAIQDRVQGIGGEASKGGLTARAAAKELGLVEQALQQSCETPLKYLVEKGPLHCARVAG